MEGRLAPSSSWSAEWLSISLTCKEMIDTPRVTEAPPLLYLQEQFHPGTLLLMICLDALVIIDVSLNNPIPQPFLSLVPLLLCTDMLSEAESRAPHISHTHGKCSTVIYLSPSLSSQAISDRDLCCESIHPEGGDELSKIFLEKSQWQTKVWFHQSSSWGSGDLSGLHMGCVWVKKPSWNVSTQQKQPLPHGCQMPLPYSCLDYML